MRQHINNNIIYSFDFMCDMFQYTLVSLILNPFLNNI